MAAVFPKIVPTGYNGDYTDFIVRVKADKSGAARLITGMVQIASATTLGTIIGLAPFNKGAKLITGGSQVYTPQLASSGTFSMGYYYSDSSSAGANAASNTSAYAVGDTKVAGTAGGLITIGNTTAGSSLAVVPGVTAQTDDLTGDGWFTLVLGGTATDQASAAISYSLLVSYDQSGVQN